MKFFLLFLGLTVVIHCANAYEVIKLQSRAILPACDTASLDYVINCILTAIRTKLENIPCQLSDDNKKYIYQTIIKQLATILNIQINSCQALRTILDGLFTTVNGVVCTLLAILGLG
ncbi:hypothetical protein RN001_009160 [Aquatica leii]|uniref:Uncharacterized protein n=1 Tax=Aquatica leii TaxID=1421715 RepID=A0AAN7P466_9COLE|nr:hypothetical protein RN001_009160 [Aquatica leii]